MPPPDPLRARLRVQILDVLRSDGQRAFRPKEIARQLGLSDQKRFALFRDVLAELQEKDEVATVRGGRVQHRPARQPGGHLAEGVLSVLAQGNGFVRLDDGSEAFVRQNRMRTALHGDRVRVALAAEPRGGRPPDMLREAEVLEVLARGRTETVGTFTQTGRAGWVRPDDTRLTHDVYVPRDAWNGARPGDKVVVSIDAFDDPKAAPEGRVLSVLGPADAPGVDVLAVAMAHGTRAAFPPEVEREAEAIPLALPEAEIARRLDLRAYPIFTIDPADAKDFDDAIHTRALPDGTLEVGVHVADVSAYVPEGSALDDEAYARATSTYLVDRVIPMLPEALSNGVCSLRPHEDKLAYSCLLTLRPDGEVLSARLAETVIHSHARLTYEQAQAVLDGAAHPLADEIRRAGRLAERLTARRLAAGAIDFDVPEVRVVLGPDGKPLDVVRKDRIPANRLIEEFMLLANRAVAEEAARRGRPLVYRVHDKPDRERIRALADYVRPFGLSLPNQEGAVTREALNRLLREVKGRPEAPVVEQAAIRAMAKAVYSPENIGHYGLGFAHYTHFTSPIRRYPDLIVHRLMKAYHAYGEDGGPVPSTEKLAVQARHCSEREQEATQAERESVRLKQVEYAEQHLGEAFAGVVVGVTKFGVFVQMTDLLTEGLVHVREMQDDFWEYDPRAYALVGRHSGRRYRTGLPVRVRIVSADPESRQVDLVFVDSDGEPAQRAASGLARRRRSSRRPR
ncbi:MAG: ribonuclease R [Rubricoccaceae bacterium]